MIPTEITKIWPLNVRIKAFRHFRISAPIKIQRASKDFNYIEKNIMSSTDSSPHPDDLLIYTLKPPASPSLTLPSPSIDFNAQLTAEEIETYDNLPPWPHAISDYVLRQIGSDFSLYEPFMDRIHKYIKSKLGSDENHLSLESPNTRKERKKPKFKKVCSFYK